MGFKNLKRSSKMFWNNFFLQFSILNLVLATNENNIRYDTHSDLSFTSYDTPIDLSTKRRNSNSIFANDEKRPSNFNNRTNLNQSYFTGQPLYATYDSSNYWQSTQSLHTKENTALYLPSINTLYTNPIKKTEDLVEHANSLKFAQSNQRTNFMDKKPLFYHFLTCPNEKDKELNGMSRLSDRRSSVHNYDWTGSKNKSNPVDSGSQFSTAKGTSNSTIYSWRREPQCRLTKNERYSIFRSVFGRTQFKKKDKK